MRKGEILTLGELNDRLEQISDGLRLEKSNNAEREYLIKVEDLVSSIVGEESSSILSNEAKENIREGLNFIEKPESPKINEFMKYFNDLIGNIVITEKKVAEKSV